MEAIVDPALKRRDSRPITDDKREIRLFITLRDEMARLPYFFEYYRKLGVNRFFVVDNGSVDGSSEFLMQQPDCHVFWTQASFGQSGFGTEWQNNLRDCYGVDHWCLAVDADELFVYPYCETVDLRALGDFLDIEGSDALYMFMLDMYAPHSLEECAYVPGTSFLETCPYFDKDYAFVNRISLRYKPHFPPQEVIGGPRARLFYKGQEKPHFLRRLRMHTLQTFVDRISTLGIGKIRLSFRTPYLFKVTLVKWRKGYASTPGYHSLNPVRLSSISGVLLHFKFFSDFHQKAVEAVENGEHFGGGSEYKRYLRYMERSHSNFMYSGSMKYSSSDDLVRLNLMKSSQEYERHAAAMQTEPARITR